MSHVSHVRESVVVGGKEISIETGKWAKQAAGSVVVRLGDTMVLVTAGGSKGPREGMDFLPLTCEYQEKFYAAGRIPGSYFRREGRPAESEILVARLMDRPSRPLFPKGWRIDTQLIANVVSFDKENASDVLAMTGASAALHLSDLVWEGPFAGIRIGRVNGQFIAFPTFAEREDSEIDMIVAATRDAIVMVEGGDERGLRGGRGRGAAVRPRGGAAAARSAREAARRGRQAEALVHRAGQGRGPLPAGQGDRLVAHPGGHGHPREARPLRRPRRGRLRGDGTALRPGRRLLRPREGGGRGDRSGQEGVRPHPHPRDPHPHRRPPLRRDPRDLVRGGRAAPRARLGAVHPRRDPGAGRGHPRHQVRRAAARHPAGRAQEAVPAALQLPALLHRRGEDGALDLAPRGRPRQPGVALGRAGAAQPRGLPVHAARGVGDPRVERIVVDGQRVRRRRSP